MAIDKLYEKKLIEQQIAAQKKMLSVLSNSVDNISFYLARYSKKFPDDYAKRITYINRMNIKRQLVAQMKSILRETDNLLNDTKKAAWSLASAKNDIITKQFCTGINVPSGLAYAMYGNNQKALESYLKNSSQIAESVKNYTGLFQDQIDTYMSSGIIQGKGAREISADMRKIANDPQGTFKKMKKDNPGVKIPFPRGGKGVYKSVSKNLTRIARQETNIAYRLGDYEKRQNMPFIVGITIHLSNAHPKFDICDSMAGSYPKGFVYSGWHVHCLCYSTSVMATKEEFKAWMKGGMKGDILQSQNVVTRIPRVAQEYVRKNESKLQKAYFYRDNFAPGTVVRLTQLMKIESPETLMKLAKDSGDEVDEFGKSLAEKFNGKVTPLNFKSKDSIIRKVTSDYNGDFSKVKDAVRSTIILPKDQIPAFLKDIENNPNVIGIKKQTLDKSPLGYTGNIINFKTTNGLTAEIQVNTEKMIYAKDSPGTAKDILEEQTFNYIKKEVGGLESGLGHKYYEQWRVLDMVQDADRMEEIERKANEYYKIFRE